MTNKKRKSETILGPQEVYNSITDLLVQIKPKLSADSTNDHVTVIADLYKLANLAESFAEQRQGPKKQGVSSSLADELDREGVNLWNMSAILRQGKDQEGRLRLFAALRLAAFRLVEAGLEQKPGIQTLLHVLQLASKTGSALSDIGNHDLAGAVLSAAAKIEESVINADACDEVHTQSRDRALIVYYTCRMEAAWKEGNEGVAQFMLRKITEVNEHRLSSLPAQDREQLASKLLGIGKGIASGQAVKKGQQPQLPASSNAVSDGKYAQDAIKWIQKALGLVENLAVSETPGILELKRTILRNLARVYYLASAIDQENLNRAEVTLHELITSIDDTPDTRHSEFQPVRWMRLAVLKRKGAPDNELFEAFRSIIGHASFKETEVTELLQELRGMAQQQQVLVTQVHRLLLETGLAIPEVAGRAAIDKILLALIFHCSRDTDHERAILAIRDACSCISERGDYELPKVPTTACQSLLWQFGERHYNAKAWGKAADWFILGTHDVFKSMARNNNAKCFRKAALCYLQQQEYGRATAVARLCRNNEAATHYIVFLIAINQGLEAEAIRAVQDLVQAKDFDRRMLLLATQLAHDAGLKTVLLTVLVSLLQFLRSQNGFDNDVEALTMIRCIIRLVIELLKQPAADTYVSIWCSLDIILFISVGELIISRDRKNLVKTLIGHFNTGKIVCESAQEKKDFPAMVKELSWLWRTAYNTAVQGCSEWTDSEEQLAELFDLSRAFMDLYRKASVTDPDKLVHGHIVLASFSSISCRVFAVRQLGTNVEQAEILRKRICRDIDEFKNSVKLAVNNGQIYDTIEEDRVGSLIHVSLVFETEQRCFLNDWQGVLGSIEEASQLPKVKANTFEAIADILWVNKNCPVNVLYSALEAILHACLDRDYVSVEKFSRWLRAICTILLAKNTSSDRTKAIGYVEQAVNVIEESSNTEELEVQRYPIDERQWLLSTSYNTGVECLAASYLDEARRWFECATVIARYVPDSKEKTQKISETYSNLLARYGRKENQG